MKFQTNAAPYLIPFTSRIENREPTLRSTNSTDILRFYQAIGRRTSKEAFKEVFGRQQKVVQGSRRNWLWTFSSDDAVLYALVSVEGVTWEYDTSKPGDPVSLMREVISEIEKACSSRA